MISPCNHLELQNSTADTFPKRIILESRLAG